MKRKLALILSLALCGGLVTACGNGPSQEAVQSETAEVQTADPAEATESPAPQEPQEEVVKEEVTTEEGIVAKGDPEKKALLVVSFGTSYNDTREVTIEAIEKDLAAAFPEYETRRAFTSQIIINKLAERDGLEIDNVKEAMERLVADGVGTLLVQPSHVMNGYEYDDMMAEINPYADHFANLYIGTPLLTASEDYGKVADALLAEYTPAEDTALVFMGHGSHHFANATYAALDYFFKAEGHPNVFVGTVEGFPEVDTVLAQVDEAGYRKVLLAPLMVVAGDHATNDMAGDEEDSWKVIFKSAGYEVETALKGMGEIPAIRGLYVEHAQAALQADED